MCFSPSIPKDNSAEIARQQEEERQGRIRAGQAKIDETFTQFDDPFYTGRQQAYSDYYAPQLEDQYTKAYKNLVFNLSRSGNLNAATGANQLDEVKNTYQTNLSDVGSRAVSFADQQRAEIEAAKNELYSQNRGAADPSAAASSAAARAGILSSAPQFSPLANVFGDVVQNSGRVLALESKGYPGFKSGLFDTPSSTVRTVR